LIEIQEVAAAEWEAIGSKRVDLVGAVHTLLQAVRSSTA
jgi:hypothetical protein